MSEDQDQSLLAEKRTCIVISPCRIIQGAKASERTLNMTEKGITWIGMQVGNCLIDRQLGEGAFSWVYHGIDMDYGKEKAFKVSKPPELVARENSGDTGQTEAKFVFSGAVTNVRPDAAKLLIHQTDKLRASACSSLVTVEKINQTGGLAYAQMEVLRTRTIRQLLVDREPVPLAALIAACRSLAYLASKPEFQYHGDLKPENIFVKASGITFIDPGYFGTIDCQEGTNLVCAVTTTLYYPTLEPDDMLAFALMLWEIATGKHPLRAGVSNETNQVGQDVMSWIQQFEGVGQYFLTPLYSLQRPAESNSRISGILERILLKALRLRLDDDGLICRDRGYETFAQLADALEGLSENGLKALPVS